MGGYNTRPDALGAAQATLSGFNDWKLPSFYDMDGDIWTEGWSVTFFGHRGVQSIVSKSVVSVLMKRSHSRSIPRRFMSTVHLGWHNPKFKAVIDAFPK